MAAVRHPRFVLRVFGRHTNSILVVFVTVQNLVRIGAVVSNFHYMLVLISAALSGVLGVLQHPGPQFWGPAIGGSG